MSAKKAISKNDPTRSSGSDSSPCSPSLGTVLDADLAKDLIECKQCRQIPNRGNKNGLPRIVEIMAIGKHWKTELVCNICGGIHTGRTLEDAIAHWQAGWFPEYSYDLPQDCSDFVENMGISTEKCAITENPNENNH